MKKEEATIISKIEKMADFQMRKSTHIQFLENCIDENVVPYGLMLKLQVQVGENGRLQESVDRILYKTSMEIARLVRDEHYVQLQEFKGSMKHLELLLKEKIKDEGEINIINASIFEKTDNKKNQIIDKQNKKLKKLIDARNKKTEAHKNDLDLQKERSTKHSPPLKCAKQKIQINKVHQTQNTKTSTSKHVNKPETTDAKANLQSDQQKNLNAQGRQEISYAEAVKMGKKVNQTNTLNQQPPILNQAINQLIKTLQALKGTDGLYVSPIDTNGANKRKLKKKWKEVRTQF